MMAYQDSVVIKQLVLIESTLDSNIKAPAFPAGASLLVEAAGQLVSSFR